MQEIRSTKVDALLRMAESGLLRPRDLEAVGIPRAYLGRLCDRGLLERVGRGLYRRVDAAVSENVSLAEVAKRVPHGVIALLSAAQLHGITSESPQAVWIMIDRRARRPSPGEIQLEVVRASGAARDHGIEMRVIDGVEVRVTTPAKTVADCFRYRSHVGLEVALDALRDYLRERLGTVEELVAAAKADRVLSVMRPYIEALV